MSRNLKKGRVTKSIVTLSAWLGASVMAILPYPPSANRMWRLAGRRLIMGKDGLAWKGQAQSELRSALIAAGVEMTGEAVAVTVTLHPKRTKSGKASQTRIDLDNAIKPTLDACNGMLWLDDKQVAVIHATIGDPMDGGGLTITACLSAPTRVQSPAE